jgi:CMP-2-keto-3-deoxyoctulosonic acid synthetase
MTTNDEIAKGLEGAIVMQERRVQDGRKRLREAAASVARYAAQAAQSLQCDEPERAWVSWLASRTDEMTALHAEVRAAVEHLNELRAIVKVAAKRGEVRP